MPLAHNFTASPPNHLGYFSPQSSAVNFCEIDYEITPYIAEFINTLTNVTYIYFAFSTLPSRSSLFIPSTWPSSTVALLLVGLGSGCFHATLRHTPQICDEVGMYAIAGSLVYDVYACGRRTYFPSTVMKSLFGVTMSAVIGWVVYQNYITHYQASHDFDIHTTLFVGLLTMFWPRLLWLIRNDGSQAETQRSNDDKQRFQARMRRFRLGVLSFGAGFAIWLVDGYQCSKLRQIRASIGLPWAWLLEFHGTWHVLTAIGAGIFVELVDEVTGKSKGTKATMNGSKQRKKLT
jgi:dihydroceramidase